MDDRKRNWWILAVLAFYLLLAAVLPAADDEVYYWCWAKELQWSYYDHPPMTAVLIRASTTIFGDSVFGFRVPACIASAFVVYVITRLTPFKPLVWGVMLSPLFTLGAVLITPDSPLVAFWAAYLWWLVELHRRLTPNSELQPSTPGSSSSPVFSMSDSQTSSSKKTPEEQPSDDSHFHQQGLSIQWWLLGGIILGCGVLSKYTMGLAVPTAFMSLVLAKRPWRNWLPGYVFHGVISFVVASPILIYNLGQNFEPLLYQWRHAAEKTQSGLMSFGDFVGVQMLLFGTLPFTLFPWVCFNARRLCQSPRLRVCTCLYAIPLAFFMYKSTQTRLQGNWALVCFISFWPLASDWYESVRQSKVWRWLTASSFLPPALAVLVAVVHLTWPIPFVPNRADRVYRQIALNAATREVARLIRELDERLPVFTDSYQMTSLLRFQSLDVQQIDGLTRPSHFTRPPRRLTDVERAYVVTEQPLPAEFAVGFSEPRKLATVPVNYRGATDRILNVWLYSK